MSFSWFLTLLFASAANAQDVPEADQAPQVEAEQGAEEVPQPRAVDPPKAMPLNQRSHGIYLDPAGRLNGMTMLIDPNSLELVPDADVDVIFIQQGRIIAQAKSNANGRFVVDGLAPRAVYSVVARSADRRSDGQTGNQTWDSRYAAFAVAVFPAAPQVATTNLRGPRFASLVRQPEGEQGISNVLTMTSIPARDLAAVGLPQTFPDNTGGAVPPAGGGGGGGGGGSGAAGGAAAGAAAAAAAAAAGSGSNVSSPFSL